jgi:hypothetical protein
MDILLPLPTWPFVESPNHLSNTRFFFTVLHSAPSALPSFCSPNVHCGLTLNDTWYFKHAQQHFGYHNLSLLILLFQI